MPETVTILEATAEANHLMAVQKASNLWKDESDKIIPEKPGYLSEKAFDEKSKLLVQKCLGQYDNTKRMLSSKYGEQYRQSLQNDIDMKLDVLKKLNDEKRAAKLLQTPLILFITIIVGWLIVFILGKSELKSFHKSFLLKLQSSQLYVLYWVRIVDEITKI